MARKCLFCDSQLGRKQRSNEHIYPDWLISYLGIKKETMTQAIVDSQGKVVPHRKPVWDAFKSGFVCSSCNEGWMSALESEAKPTLIQLIEGNLIGKLSGEACHLVTAWAFKTAMTLGSVSSIRRCIPDEHFKAINGRNAIPARVWVSLINIALEPDYYWMTNNSWSYLSPHLATNVNRLTLSRNSYRISFRARNLAIRVHYWPHPNNVFDYISSSGRCISLVTQNGVEWPPRDRVDRLQEVDESLFITN
jgi:hypothetical protein